MSVEQGVQVSVEQEAQVSADPGLKIKTESPTIHHHIEQCPLPLLARLTSLFLERYARLTAAKKNSLSHASPANASDTIARVTDIHPITTVHMIFRSLQSRTS